MRLGSFASAAALALLLVGCSKPAHDTVAATAPHVEVVRLPGIPPPVLIRVAEEGIAEEGCGNTDGPAVEFVYKVDGELPTTSITDESATNLKLVLGLPLVGNQELHVRVNATLARVRDLRQWTIGNSDTDGGLLAWTCPVGGFPCDFATRGTVTFTRASGDVIEGTADLTFQSNNTTAGNFSAKLLPRAVNLRCG
jgi:hypothetical protein